jgi:hypothetical protein
MGKPDKMGCKERWPSRYYTGLMWKRDGADLKQRNRKKASKIKEICTCGSLNSASIFRYNL